MPAALDQVLADLREGSDAVGELGIAAAVLRQDHDDIAKDVADHEKRLRVLEATGHRNDWPIRMLMGGGGAALLWALQQLLTQGATP